MPIVFLVVVGSALILGANLLARSRNDQLVRLFDWLLFSLNLPLLIAGPLAIFIPQEQLAILTAGTEGGLQNQASFGLTLLGMAIWGCLVSWRAARQRLGRWLPLDPFSPVHALALQMSGWLAGSTLLTLTQGGLESLAATAVPADIVSIVSQFVLFFLLAVFGIGLFIRRDAVAVIRRLGLERPDRRQLIAGCRWIVVLVLIQWGFGAISTLLDPGQLELLDDISASLLGDIDTIWEWLILALSTGIGEELLFRGAMQPVLGLKFTALLFAIAHVQYGITPITLTIAIIGIALGYIRREYSTTVAIFVHAGYNFALGLVALLATHIPG
jgi:membrane protease YdiL (CAAX protease family)